MNYLADISNSNGDSYLIDPMPISEVLEAIRNWDECKPEGVVITEIRIRPVKESEPVMDEPELLPGEDMDGDHASALASAGMGTDEDYGYFGERDETPLGDELDAGCGDVE